MSSRVRLLMLVLDGVALIGLLIFSVAAALNRDNNLYLAGQILCAAWVLWAAFVLRQANRRAAENHTTEEDTDE
jgi:threonine/homoserine/homoserine lactone efflux protein